REELLPVAARQVRDRAHDTLAPQQLVREGRDVAHVDPGADDRAALCESGERSGNQLARRREDDRGVELLRGRAGAGPLGAQRSRELLRLVVARPCEREHAAALPARATWQTMCADAPK